MNSASVVCGKFQCRWSFSAEGNLAHLSAREAYREHLRLEHGLKVDDEE